MVVDILATAHTWRGGDGPYSVAPVAGLLLSLFLIWKVLRLPIGPVGIGVAVGLGALFASVGGRWGFEAGTGLWLGSFWLVALVRRGARPFRRNASD